MGKWKTKLKKRKKIRHIIYAVYCIFFFSELLLLSSTAMWVAIDCRSKNWVAVLKSLGSTDKCKFSSYFTENTSCLRHKYQPVNVV
jgi:hypothetical protein